MQAVSKQVCRRHGNLMGVFETVSSLSSFGPQRIEFGSVRGGRRFGSLSLSFSLTYSVHYSVPSKID